MPLRDRLWRSVGTCTKLDATLAETGVVELLRRDRPALPFGDGGDDHVGTCVKNSFTVRGFLTHDDSVDSRGPAALARCAFGTEPALIRNPPAAQGAPTDRRA